MSAHQNTRTLRRSIATTGLAVAASAVLLSTLSGCAELTASSKIQQKHFDTHADTPTKGDLAWVLSDWVPKDATDIDVKLNTSYPGYDLRFSSATGVDFSACQALDQAYGGPALEADFLPKPVPTKDLFTCGDGRVATTVDGKYYSWTTEKPIVGESESGDRTGRLRGDLPTESATSTPSPSTPTD